MDFNKIISDMKELQEKVNSYEKKEKIIQAAITGINKDITKLEKKAEKEINDIDKTMLHLKILTMKDVVDRFDFNNKGDYE